LKASGTVTVDEDGVNDGGDANADAGADADDDEGGGAAGGDVSGFAGDRSVSKSRRPPRTAHMA
jgi:hypothetical protein